MSLVVRSFGALLALALWPTVATAQAPAVLKTGGFGPEFSMKSHQGGIVANTTLRGRPYVLVFASELHQSDYDMLRDID